MTIILQDFSKEMTFVGVSEEIQPTFDLADNSGGFNNPAYVPGAQVNSQTHTRELSSGIADLIPNNARFSSNWEVL